MTDQQPQPETHVVKCARCRKNPGIEPGYIYEPCHTCKGVGSVAI